MDVEHQAQAAQEPDPLDREARRTLVVARARVLRKRRQNAASHLRRKARLGERVPTWQPSDADAMDGLDEETRDD